MLVIKNGNNFHTADGSSSEPENNAASSSPSVVVRRCRPSAHKPTSSTSSVASRLLVEELGRMTIEAAEKKKGELVEKKGEFLEKPAELLSKSATKPTETVAKPTDTTTTNSAATKRSLDNAKWHAPRTKIARLPVDRHSAPNAEPSTSSEEDNEEQGTASTLTSAFNSMLGRGESKGELEEKSSRNVMLDDVDSPPTPTEEDFDVSIAADLSAILGNQMCLETPPMSDAVANMYR